MYRLMNEVDLKCLIRMKKYHSYKGKIAPEGELFKTSLIKITPSDIFPLLIFCGNKFKNTLIFYRIY
ncbi:hypothetical protein C6A34_11840 [Bacillus thuringiensis]|nr:hypothetical protein C6A34_11840 [Bacillus thuringiensis]